MSAAGLANRDVQCSGVSAAVRSGAAHGSEVDTVLADSRCVAALIVAVNQASDARQWYTQTKDLRLASLQLCEACRIAHTVHLTVTKDTPACLLAVEDATQTHAQEDVSSRLPRLRVRRLTWALPTLDLLSSSFSALGEVEELCLSSVFKGGLEVQTWPSRLQAIKFKMSSRFDRPIDSVTWPASLRQLTFGGGFNQPIEGVKWPTSLQRLTFGFCFNHPIEGVAWPSLLIELAFDESFNQPIEGVRWPRSLQRLTFEGDFNQPIGGVRWPMSLKQVAFNFKFDQQVEGVTWPTSLENLHFGVEFNQPVEGVTWPASLRLLTLGHEFNQPIKDVKWPTTLQRLHFGRRFNLPIAGVTWPRSLRQLTFGDGFNQPIEGVRWPVLLEELEFGDRFDKPVLTMQWPSLRRFALAGNFCQSLHELGKAMPALEVFELFYLNESTQYRMLRGINWPAGLKRLAIDADAHLEGVSIPPNVKVVQLRFAPWQGTLPLQL